MISVPYRCLTVKAACDSLQEVPTLVNAQRYTLILYHMAYLHFIAYLQNMLTVLAGLIFPMNEKFILATGTINKVSNLNLKILK